MFYYKTGKALATSIFLPEHAAGRSRQTSSIEVAAAEMPT
jgi:hypothetical protein